MNAFVEMEQPSPETPVAEERRGARVKTAVRSADIRDETIKAGLEYNSQPNSLNPVVAWPILPGHSFATMCPAYYGLPSRPRLFKHLFGFKSWEDAMVFMRVAFPEEFAPKSQRAILHPKFQYLAALWRMRRDESIEALAAFFGVLPRRMVGAASLKSVAL